MHSKIKFIGVAIGDLGAHGLETVLFAVIVGGALFVVFFLFEEAEVSAGLGLGAFFVGDSFDGIAEGGHGGLFWG